MNAPTKTSPAMKVTPMMAQYMGIKEEAGEDVLLFYRMGDFYELFFQDAVKAAAALDIALTKRGKHQGVDIPMCGVPVHAAETYLQRLIRKGFRVAVCEQTESPAEAKKRGYKSVVRREIVRIVTPGTLTEDTLLDARDSNHIVSLFRSNAGDYAIAWADISDGRFSVSDVSAEQVAAEISALSPQELIVPDTLLGPDGVSEDIPVPLSAYTPQPKSAFNPRSGEAQLTAMFDVSSLDGFGSFSRNEVSAAGALINYLELTQAGNPVKLSPPRQQATGAFMAIDPATRASLEITASQQGGRAGSLLGTIDRTVTGPGARELSERLSRPLTNVSLINARLDEVSYFVDTPDVRASIRELLKQAGDPARALSRLVLGRGGPRDIKALGTALGQGDRISARFAEVSSADIPERTSESLEQLTLANFANLAQLNRDIDKAFQDDVPMLARDGGFIRSDWHAGLAELRSLRDNSRKVIAGLQAKYAEKTGITSLKVKHNNVLGYHIEVTPKHADTMLSGDHAADFIHRQTLVSGVRFTTTELVELDSKISSAADKALGIEQEVFAEFVRRVSEVAETIRSFAAHLASLDAATALAEWANTSHAKRPIVDDSLAFNIDAGRHPVVEAALQSDGQAAFTPNDATLDASGQDAPRLVLITGPNMAGKSTYLRQNALMCILAQAGSFVPAGAAHIGIVDRLFSRVGASDDLSKGRSTFMVEMIETAAILNGAGERSFVILDEIGRGTATFDGLSIAWATAEHLHTVNKSRAMFATHYHELTDMVDKLDAGANASLRAKEWDGQLIFLHDVKPGAADKSYGVQVARLAGLPEAAVTRARDVLTRLEQEHDTTQDSLGSLPLFSATPPRAKPSLSEVELSLKNLDPDTLSPREALDLLYDLSSKVKQKRSSGEP